MITLMFVWALPALANYFPALAVGTISTLAALGIIKNKDDLINWVNTKMPEYRLNVINYLNHVGGNMKGSNTVEPVITSGGTIIPVRLPANTSSPIEKAGYNARENILSLPMLKIFRKRQKTSTHKGDASSSSTPPNNENPWYKRKKFWIGYGTALGTGLGLDIYNSIQEEQPDFTYTTWDNPIGWIIGGNYLWKKPKYKSQAESSTESLYTEDNDSTEEVPDSIWR